MRGYWQNNIMITYVLILMLSTVLCGYSVETAYAENPQEQSDVSTLKQHVRKVHMNSMIITIHIPQRTSKISLIRLPSNKNAFLFQIRVICFARYTV